MKEGWVPGKGNKIQPRLIYFWIITLRDGRSIPQFNPETGEEIPYDPSLAKNISKAMWVPFSPEFAKMVREHGRDVIPTPFPRHEVDLRDNDELLLLRRGFLSQFNYYHCTNCGEDFTWDGSEELECPRCGAINMWYCRVCDEIKDDPRYMPGGEVQCRDCPIPQGLERIINLESRHAETLETHYLIGIKGKFVTHISGEKAVTMEYDPDDFGG